MCGLKWFDTIHADWAKFVFSFTKILTSNLQQILFRMAEQIKDSNSTSVLALCTSVDVYHNNAELQSQVYCMILQTTTRY